MLKITTLFSLTIRNQEKDPVILQLNIFSSDGRNKTEQHAQSHTKFKTRAGTIILPSLPPNIPQRGQGRHLKMFLNYDITKTQTQSKP